MKLFFKLLSVLSLPAFLMSSFQSDNELRFQTSFITNKGSAEFDTSSVFESVFTPVDISDTAESLSENSFPESFDLRDCGYVQNVKAQGEYGTCWTQTAVDSAESGLIKRVSRYRLVRMASCLLCIFGR